MQRVHGAVCLKSEAYSHNSRLTSTSPPVRRNPFTRFGTVATRLHVRQPARPTTSRALTHVCAIARPLAAGSRCSMARRRWASGGLSASGLSHRFQQRSRASLSASELGPTSAGLIARDAAVSTIRRLCLVQVCLSRSLSRAPLPPSLSLACSTQSFQMHAHNSLRCEMMMMMRGMYRRRNLVGGRRLQRARGQDPRLPGCNAESIRLYYRQVHPDQMGAASGADQS